MFLIIGFLGCYFLFLWMVLVIREFVDQICLQTCENQIYVYLQSFLFFTFYWCKFFFLWMVFGNCYLIYLIYLII